MSRSPVGPVIVIPPLATEAEFNDAGTKLDADYRGTVTVRIAELAPDAPDKITDATRFDMRACLFHAP
ncbi:hypothetical protein M878_08610 [Streptomyces roseochromogenus subsp. oscitans DS 12.976]|uniref:Uncharacterized protein n=1 Tax=Streptomyces roseochromogenus subsp. oscitans DS 12.976 TaxID=1352936 RepID=V6KU24_STRRC|nr:hypothetical protein M878_08610 [Streptomyces roseochromogenus subsp. oscitans DS 12.976]